MTGYREIQYFLSGDTGGTKTDWRLLDASGKVQIAFTLEGMASLHAGELPVAALARETAQRIDVIPQLVYLSLGGPNEDEVRSALIAAFPASRIVVEREAEGSLIAFAAEHLGFQAVVMAGTGVAALGLDGGRRRYAEGWGPVYGDRASGGGIGNAALKLFLRSVDGLADAGRVAELFANLTAGLDVTSFAGRMAMKQRVHAITRRDLAALAPQVAALAEAGDRAAGSIMAETAGELGAIASAVTPPGGTVLWLGGLFRLGAAFRSACNAALKKRRPDCRSRYDERFSLGTFAAARTLALGGVRDLPIKELFYGN